MKYHIFWTVRQSFPQKIWEGNGGASYHPNVAYLAHSGGAGEVEQGRRSRVTAAGSLMVWCVL